MRFRPTAKKWAAAKNKATQGCSIELGAGGLVVPESIDCVRSGVLTLPTGWSLDGRPPMVSFWHVSGLVVIASEEVYPSGPDGGEDTWLHVSASRRAVDPSWQDMCRVKTVFVGADREAIQLHPPKDEYVNLHPHCLHLWTNLARRVMPDLRKFHPQLGHTL